MEVEEAKEYFLRPEVVEEYVKATNHVGLWVSEQRIFQRLFRPEQSLIELGCGAGRIAIGLWELGYKHILGIDYSKEMIREARRINQVMEYGVSFQVGDARSLKFPDNHFDGAIFGFNGLMQIPGRANRRKAMREIHRVLVPGAWFVFTTHDRAVHNQAFWRKQKEIWDSGKQDPRLEMFGDLCHELEGGGRMYIHSPSREEILEDAEATGFRVEVDVMRSQLCNEPLHVREFSDDCRFWIWQKPAK